MRIAPLVLLLALMTASSASAASTVVPNAYASVGGEAGNSAPFVMSGGVRYQQVFAASQFSGAMSIGRLALRNWAGNTAQPFTATIPSIDISLSTTAAGPNGLDYTFANNIGSDNTQVYSGSLTLSSTNAAGPGNTRVFDVIINLQTPFYYNPSLGNLLLDVRSQSGSNTVIYLDSAVVFDDSVSRALTVALIQPPDSATGQLDSIGLIIEFAAIPEPSTFLLASLGVALLAWRRRNP